MLAGANADDVLDVRPGLLAADQQGVRNPLLDEGVGKAQVRAIATHLGLSVAAKPALACLSSRVAFGVRITPDLLARIDRAEQGVRSLGFDQVERPQRSGRVHPFGHDVLEESDDLSPATRLRSASVFTNIPISPSVSPYCRLAIGLPTQISLCPVYRYSSVMQAAIVTTKKVVFSACARLRRCSVNSRGRSCETISLP